MEARLFLGRYQVLRLLGEGGMGRVYLARQLDLNRLVVVKVLHEHHALTPHHREAFRREIDFMTRFRHPGAVQLHEASFDDPHGPCIVMEYIEGLPLDELLQRHGRLTLKHVSRLLGRLCAVLQAAHDQGIVHRDLKPANIMVVAAGTPAERVKVLDFGLARLAPASSDGLYIPLEKFTGARAHAAAGTPEYVCPEQFRGDEADHRGDLYSVGVILYELLTGRRPFDGPSINALISAHLFQAPPPFAQRGGPPLPPAIEEVVLACLAKDPAARPPSARDLALRYGEALGQPIWEEEEPLAPPASVPPPAPAALPAIEEETDPNAIVYRLEAWMPERMAAIKLRGFLSAIDGEVSESVPGLIRVRLQRRRRQVAPAPAAGLWSRLGFGKRSAPVPEFDPVEMDLYLGGAAGGPQGRLPITVRLRPANGDAGGPEWRAWCDQIHANLSAYLMVKR